MREIKFRAYNVSEQQMYLSPPDICHLGSWFDAHLPGALSDSDNIIIMQFTGLHDKNGTEIYEKDICRILHTDWPSNSDPSIPLDEYLKSISSVGYIAYEAPSFWIMLKDRYGDYLACSMETGTHGRIEVIGNIHQHPHLLKESEAQS